MVVSVGGPVSGGLPFAVDDPLVLDSLPPVLPAPDDLVRRYVELSQQRRALDEQLAFLRGELELLAAQALSEASPRGRFVSPDGGMVVARLRPTCVFDRVQVGRELERGGRLHEVALLQGPALARFLAREPVWAARLGGMVRARRGIVLMVGTP